MMRDLTDLLKDLDVEDASIRRESMLSTKCSTSPGIDVFLSYASYSMLVDVFQA